MTNCKEIRGRTRQILSGKWFVRLLLVAMALGTVISVADKLVLAAFGAAEITSLRDFVERWAEARQQGLNYALPTARATFWMLSGFVFEMFIGYVFAAIAAFGVAGLLLKAEANRDDRWFADSFGGFARPLEMTWLLLSVNVKVALWSLLLLVPGIVAVYRYRLAWFLKNDRPEMKSGECIAESGRLMDGWKWTAFRLDISYVLRICVASLFIVSLQLFAMLFGGSGAAATAISLAVTVFGGYLVFRLAMAMMVARAVLYREILKEKKD